MTYARPEDITRRRSGKGFSYWTADGEHLEDPAQLSRIKALVIPPAWTEVGIAADPEAPLQATGLDQAGRIQYLYHPRWREQQEQEKFARSLRFAAVLPRVRRRVTVDLRGDDERLRALAVALRMIDTMALRVGGEQYAEENGSFGVSTLRRRHVELTEDGIRLLFRGKSGGTWDVGSRDPQLRRFFGDRPRTPTGAAALCWPERRGRRVIWHGVPAAEINAYLGTAAGGHYTAKDFRTWQGTTAAARAMAAADRRGLAPGDAVSQAVDEAAALLHNTKAVARSSYIHPELISRFEQDPGLLRGGRLTDGRIRSILAD